MKGLNREILRLALPSILANLTVPLVGMVDIAVAGHLNGGGATFIGGITIGSMLFDLLYWNFSFLRSGTGGLTAQSFGRKDMAECSKILFRGIGTALTCALVLMLIQKPFTSLAFLAIDCSEGVMELALKYFFIRIWAAPATLALMAFKGWFIGMQDSVCSMFSDLIVNVVNIFSSIVLAMGAFGWEGVGYVGIAWGTVIAQYSGLLFCLIVALAKYHKVLAHIKNLSADEIFKRSELRGLFKLNMDLFLRSLCFIGIYVGYSMIAARYGDLMLAVSAIMMKILLLFSYFTDGFAFAGEALCGRFIGERNISMTKETVSKVFAWSLGIAFAFIFLYVLGGDWMLRVMTSDGEVELACKEFLFWLVLMPPIGCAAFTWDGIFLGATASKAMRNSMMLAACLYFSVWFILSGLFDLSPENAIHCLLAAYFVHLLVRTVYLSATYKKDVLGTIRGSE